VADEVDLALVAVLEVGRSGRIMAGGAGVSCAAGAKVGLDVPVLGRVGSSMFMSGMPVPVRLTTSWRFAALWKSVSVR